MSASSFYIYFYLYNLFLCYHQVSLEEYFDSEDSAEAIRAITELGCPEYHYEVVSLAFMASSTIAHQLLQQEGMVKLSIKFSAMHLRDPRVIPAPENR